MVHFINNNEVRNVTVTRSTQLVSRLTPQKGPTETHIYILVSPISLNMVSTRRQANEPKGRKKTEKRQKTKISRNMKDKNSKTSRNSVHSRKETAQGKRPYIRRFKSPEEEEAYKLRVMERKNITRINATLRMSEWRAGLTEEKRAEIRARGTQHKREARKALKGWEKAEIQAREAQRRRESRKLLSPEQKALLAKKKAEYRLRKRQEEEGGSAKKAEPVERRSARRK